MAGHMRCLGIAGASDLANSATARLTFCKQPAIVLSPPLAALSPQVKLMSEDIPSS